MIDFACCKTRPSITKDRGQGLGMLDGVAMAHFGLLNAHFVGSAVEAFGRGGLVKDCRRRSASFLQR
jgi:hypothetical protein